MNLFELPDEAALGGTKPGLRLFKLEAYNWGTFNKVIWKYEPKGETSLLTGESGSGKSTLVDALITLFVSPRKAAYNKAADASARERTLTSYARGYHGQKYAYDGKGKPEALRGTDKYSVVLAALKDENLGTAVSLAVFIWFQDNRPVPNKFYVVSQSELSVAEHFTNFNSDIKVLRKNLKSKGVEVFDDYNHYAMCYQKKLGLNEQATDLFQQTVSMKKVEALTDFVRSNMLEDTAIGDDIERLLSHYHDLSKAYEAVLRARKQIEMLTPINVNGNNYNRAKADSFTIGQAQESLEYWFAINKAALYETKIEQSKKLLENEKILLQEEETKQNNIEGSIKHLIKEIALHGGQALENLQAELSRKGEELSRRAVVLSYYKIDAQKVGLPVPEQHSIFVKNAERILTLQSELADEQENEQNERDNISIDLNDVSRKIHTMQGERDSLRGRKSNIPGSLIRLRDELCEALGVASNELPFAGELIEVKENESVWEGAIERLLHGFAVSLLVEERFYTKVAKWVNDKSLQTRIVYFRVNQMRPAQADRQRNLPTVVSKIDIKPDTPYTVWLERELEHRFDHICCKDIAVFQQSPKGITKEGQIKFQNRHEKDDKYNISDRSRYVLGFSSEKKIAALTEILKELHTQKGALDSLKQAVSLRLKTIDEKNAALSALDKIKSFSDINVEAKKLEIQQCRQQIDVIKSGNSTLATLEKRLSSEEAMLDRQKRVVKDQEKRMNILEKENELLQLRKKENDIKITTKTATESICKYIESSKAQFIGNVEITIDNSEQFEKKYGNALRIEQEAIISRGSDFKAKIEKAMTHFKHEYQLETREMDDTVESLNEYNQLLEQLQRDSLPDYESQFKDLLRTKVLNQIALFHATLRGFYDNVKARIDNINESLYGIDYNPQRYIKLNCEDNTDAEIKAFRIKLKACTEGVLGSSLDKEDMLEQKFLQIKEIIERFKGREKETEADKKWTKKVTDVRNWFIFSASERFRDNNEEYEHYTDSGGKSGGQKEKLAYTILAASLVYNYGLHRNYSDKTSFRLVVIDEAFLKSSDDSAKFGLQLFKQLDFQLVIVTPLLKIATIEPFIAHVGFVSHNDITHESSIMNIGIEKYKEKRKEWEESHLA